MALRVFWRSWLFAFTLVALVVTTAGTRGVPLAQATDELYTSRYFAAPGDTVTIWNAAVCPSGQTQPQTLTLYFDGVQLGGIAADWCASSGYVFTATFNVPANAPQGVAAVTVMPPALSPGYPGEPVGTGPWNGTVYVTAPGDPWITVATDRPTYEPGDSVQVCYTVSRPGQVEIFSQIPGASPDAIFGGTDDGSGGCVVGVAGNPGTRTVTAYLMDDGSVIAESATTFVVVDAGSPSPPATQPPATQPPATRPPATQPPATQPPGTQPPATQPPATQPPATQPPATQPPPTGDVGRITVPAGPLTDACEYLEDTDNLPAKRAANLVLVTHGWNGPFGSPGAGDDIGLAEPIREYLNDRANDPAGADDWDVIGLDWTPFAGQPSDHFWGPQVARRHAQVLGSCLGQSLSQRGYTYVHLIAHSAGTALIDEVSSHLAGSVQVHLTMLDAYLPISDEARKTFGSSADWIDHYYRQDRSKDCGPTNPFACALGPTDLPLGRACNVDMTELSDPAGYRLSEPHGGPIWFYRWSIESPSGPATTWGFPKSREATGGSPQLCQPGSIQYLKDTTSVNVPPIDLSEQVQKLTPLDGDLFNKTTGTGTFSTTDDGGIQLGSGSPSGVEANVTLGPGANGIAFSYAFTTPGEGVLTFELDGVLM